MTPMVDGIAKDSNSSDPKSVIEGIRIGIPMKRLGTIEELGELAAFLASDEYKEQDSEVLSAIACHTTGKIGMTPLEQIVFIADYMEPNRKMIPGLSKVRKLAFEDLDKCTKTILKNTIEYLTECGQEIDERTVETYKYYRDKKEN